MNNVRLRVLFVDDEPRILDGLRRQLRGRRQQWEMRFALSGEDALHQLDEKEADIVVTDMRMPGMHGGELLQIVRERHPGTTRLVLSGQTDSQELLQDIGAIHQFLQKPCDAEYLCHAIERAFRLTQLLLQPQLRLTANRVTALPPSSQAHQALVAELSRPDASLAAVGDIVDRDAGLSVKLMQLVNSAFFGMPRSINSPREAVVLLGLRNVHTIVIASRLFRYFEAQPHAIAAVNELWNSSFRLGDLTGRLARRTGAGEQFQMRCRLAGLLAFVGRAIMATADLTTFGHAVNTSIVNHIPLTDAESRVYDARQYEVGAYALGLWGFPDDMVDAVHFQNAPALLPSNPIPHPGMYLHVARHLMDFTLLGAKDPSSIDSRVVDTLGLNAAMDMERRAVA